MTVTPQTSSSSFPMKLSWGLLYLLLMNGCHGTCAFQIRLAPATSVNRLLAPQLPTRSESSEHVLTLLPNSYAYARDTRLRALEQDDEESEQHKTAQQTAAYNAKFGLGQRIDSTKSLVVGALAGSVAVAIPAFLHQTVLNAWLLSESSSSGMDQAFAQFEFDTDASAVLAGLFAIVYRYCLRMDGDDNEQLKQGVVGAFVLTRTLSRLVVPSSCSAFPLACGAPFEYLNWNMISQLLVNGVESAILFAAAAAAMDYCMERGWISKFPA